MLLRRPADPWDTGPPLVRHAGAVRAPARRAPGWNPSLPTHGEDMPSTTCSRLRCAALVVAGLALVSGTVVGQTSGSRKAWRVTGQFSIESEVNSNVFLLSPTQLGELDPPSAAALASGRYSNMERALDVVTALTLALGLKGPALGGRSLEIVPEVSYDYYAQNPDRRNVAVGLTIEQALPSGSAVRLRGRLRPEYFAKNYLVDAVDSDGNDLIEPAERMYRRGTYRDAELSLDIRVRLAKSTKRRPFGAAVRLGAGYYRRDYETPFAGRDRRGPTADALMSLTLSRAVELDLDYALASLSATPTSQVLVVDEAAVGRDLNGNGSATDLEVRTVAVVDRSRLEHRAGASLQFGRGRGPRLTIGYERRWRRYTSEEPDDVAYNGRRDTRDRVDAEVRFPLARQLQLTFGGQYTDQNLNRADDPGALGDINDYRRFSGRAGLTFQF